MASTLPDSLCTTTWRPRPPAGASPHLGMGAELQGDSGHSGAPAPAQRFPGQWGRPFPAPEMPHRAELALTEAQSILSPLEGPGGRCSDALIY